MSTYISRRDFVGESVFRYMTAQHALEVSSSAITARASQAIGFVTMKTTARISPMSKTAVSDSSVYFFFTLSMFYVFQV